MNKEELLEKALDLACIEIHSNCSGFCEKCTLDKICDCSDDWTKKAKQYFINEAKKEIISQHKKEIKSYQDKYGKQSI